MIDIDLDDFKSALLSARNQVLRLSILGISVAIFLVGLANQFFSQSYRAHYSLTYWTEVLSCFSGAGILAFTFLASPSSKSPATKQDVANFFVNLDRKIFLSFALPFIALYWVAEFPHILVGDWRSIYWN